jgi:hypothetical protein
MLGIGDAAPGTAAAAALIAAAARRAPAPMRAERGGIELASEA